MKTRLLIVSVIIGIGLVAFLVIGGFTSIESGQKYQYKFWQKNVEFENANYFTRVLFSRSDDYGKTFSEPIDMSMTELNAHEPKMIIMHDDVLLVWRDEIKRNDRWSSILSFAKSTDFGNTFEKKRLFYGARPEMKYYGETLYLTYVDVELREILYSKSDDGGETFSESKSIFKVDWELNQYEDRPKPTLEVDSDQVIITWETYDKNNQHMEWKAIDYNIDDSFEITSSLVQAG